MEIKDEFDNLIRLWHKTQIGNINKCRENQLIFSDIMWSYYNNLKEKNENE